MLEHLPGYDAWLDVSSEWTGKTMLMQLSPYAAQCRVLREKLKDNRVPDEILLVVTGLDALGYPPWAEKWVPAALAFMGVLEIDVTDEEQDDASR